MKIIITENQFKLISNIDEQPLLKNGYPLFYHGTTDKKLNGKTGIHVGTKMAAKQALEAKIGVPVNGEWDGTREYGKTLLAGKKTLQNMNYIVGHDPIMAFNATEDVPDDDYYPNQRKKRATYFSSNVPIPLDCKPTILKVIITGEMGNTYDTPITDSKANKLKNPTKGYYYTNKWEDETSISAVLPNSSFLKVIKKKQNT
jgi:hypothetical protein